MINGVVVYDEFDLDDAATMIVRRFPKVDYDKAREVARAAFDGIGMESRKLPPMLSNAN